MLKNILLCMIAFIGILYGFTKYRLEKTLPGSKPKANASQYIYYFAYGSNMSPKYLYNLRAVLPVKSSCALAERYRVSFSLLGIKYVEPSFATLVFDENSRAYGVVHKILRSDFEKIVASESAEYEVAEIQVTICNGGSHLAKTLLTKKEGSQSVPSQRYLNLLIAGATEVKLPADYIAQLELMRGPYFPIISEILGSIIYLALIISNL